MLTTYIAIEGRLKIFSLLQLSTLGEGSYLSGEFYEMKCRF